MSNGRAINFGVWSMMIVYTFWISVLMWLASDGVGQWMLLVGLSLLAMVGTGLTFWVVAMGILSNVDKK